MLFPLRIGIEIFLIDFGLFNGNVQALTHACVLIAFSGVCISQFTNGVLTTINIQQGLSQNERLIQLNKVAMTQMKCLVENKAIKNLK